MSEIIVIGGNHHNTLGVIRSLGEKGLQSNLIIVTKEKKPFVAYSKYLKSVVHITDNEMIPSTLLSRFKVDGEKPVVICCSDPSSGVIDENLNLLKGYFSLPGAETEGRISELMSKKRMTELAQECGICPPPTLYLSGSQDDISRIEYPCIAKPLVSRRAKKADIRILHTKQELMDFIEEVDIDNYQIQKFIDKEGEYQLIGCSTKDEVIIPGVSRILRPCKGSNTSFLHYEALKEDFCEMEMYRELIKKTGYHGLFSLEFLRDKNGQDYFLEINFRNDGNAICVTAAGMNLPYIWYLDCLDKDYTKELAKTINPVYVMPDMAELKLLVTRQISLRQYMSDLKMTNRFMEYDRRDPKPFWRIICSKLHLW